MARTDLAEGNTRFTFVISQKLKEELGVIATSQHRSISNLILSIVTDYVEQYNNSNPTD